MWSMQGRQAHSRARALVRGLPGTLGVLLVLSAVAACGGASGGVPAVASVPPALPGGPGGVSAGSAAPPAARAVQGSVGTADSSTTNAGQPVDAATGGDQPLIVETGALELEVRSLDTALLKASAAIQALSGYVSASDRSDRGERQMAVVTYRVPAARWSDALDALRPLASRVVSEKTQAVEVTGQVLDLGARIENLRVTEKALQAIMARATKISDVLEVQAQLTSVQGEIEQLTTQKSHLEQQAAMGTLTVTYEVPVVAVAAAASAWNPGQQLDAASAQLVEIGQALLTLGIWLGIVVLPLLGLLVLVLGPLALIARRLLPRHPGGTPVESA